MKMICEFCGVRTSSFGLDMRDLLRLVPRLEDVALKSAFEDAARTSPRWVIRPKDGSRSPSRGMKVYQVSAQHSPDAIYCANESGRAMALPSETEGVTWRRGRKPRRDQRTFPWCRS